jgi:hypothetical protein
MRTASADFVQNNGQWNNHAKFLARGKGLDFWITQKGFVLDAYSGVSGGSRRGHVLGVDFLGSNSQTTVTAAHETNFISQFVRPKEAPHTAHSFKDVNISGLYAGIDLHAYKQDAKPRYDLIVAPGADASKIRMKIAGTDFVTVNKKGNLMVKTVIGALTEQDLMAYQMVGPLKHRIPASFRVGKDNVVEFALGSYDHSRKLVIDPIIYGSFYGGDHGMDEVRAVVSDGDGGVFMTGSTFASDFPLVLGPYVSKSGNSDAFMSKFQGDAYVHNFASYFGGTGDETGKYIALDPSGNNLWIAGTTSSATFPMVGAGSFQQTRTGTTDTFIIKWAKDPNQVLTPQYATYFGSTSAGNGEEIKGFGIGPVSGDVFVAGVTSGTGIPGAINAYPGAPTNAFITRMNNSATAVTWSRYIEGTARQTLGISTYLGLPVLFGGTNPGTTNTEGNLTAKLAPNALAVDNEESCVIAGTVSFVGNQDTGVAPVPAFKTTPGVFVNTTFGQNGRLLRNNDMFVEKLDGNGGLFYGAVLGGADQDQGVAVAVDKFGNAYVTGVAASHDFPRTFGTFGQVFTQQPIVTVTKLNQDCSQILYSTNLRTHQSPSGAVYPVGVSVDNRGFAFITGLIIDGAGWPAVNPPPDPDPPTTATTDPGHVPTTADAIRPTYTYPGISDVPTFDAWLVVLDDTAQNEIYGTYIGGQTDDMIFPPYNDRFGDVWVAGSTDSWRDYTVWDSMFTTGTPHRVAGGIGPFITPLAFKVAGEEEDAASMGLITTPYGILDEVAGGGGRAGNWTTPNPPPFGSAGGLGLFISTGRSRDGYVMRFRLQIPIITNLTLAPPTIPGGLGATSTGTITLDTPATGAGVDAVVTLSDVSAASFDPTTPVSQIVVNIPAGQTTGTFTMYSLPVTSPTQVDVKASYLGNFKQARLSVVPWLQNFVLSPSTAIGGNNVSGVITLAAPAPAGGFDVTLLTDDASTVLFPGGNTVTVPAGQTFTNFQIQTMGVDQQHDFTVTASALSVGVSNFLTLKPASLLSVTFQPGRVAGGTSSTGTCRLDGLPGPSGFNVDLSIVGNPVGYTVSPTPLVFTAADRSLDFTVTTQPETLNTQKIIIAHRAAQGTYSDQSKQGTLFIDANFLTNLVLNPTTVNAGQSSTGTVTISNTAQAGGVVVNLLSDNPAVAQVPATVTVPAGSTLGNFTITTAATATDTVVKIHAKRGTADLFKNLTVKGVTFTLSASPNSVIGGAQNITGTIHLALVAPAGGVQVSFTSSVPAAASVPSSPVTVPQGVKDFNFTIVTNQVAATQNVTITGQTQPGTTATVIVQIRAISLASLVITPTYVKGGSFVHIQVTLDAPAPAGGANVTLSSSNTAVINPPGIFIAAGQTQSAVITVPVNRVNRTLAVTITGGYNGRQLAQTVTVYR